MFNHEIIRKETILKDFNINNHVDSVGYPLHWHSFFEVEFFTQGCADHLINGRLLHSTPGFITIMTPKDFHKFTSVDGGHLIIQKFVFTDRFLSKKVCAVLQAGRGPWAVQLNEQEMTKMLAVFRDMEALNQRKEEDLSYLTLKNVAERICIQIMQSVQGNAIENVPVYVREDETYHQIIKFVEDHFSEPLRLCDICAITHQSGNYFSHYFKTVFGVSFSEYLKSYRLIYAANLLSSTQNSISDICFSSGFSSMTFFNRTFKQQFGVTPRKYRELHHTLIE